MEDKQLTSQESLDIITRMIADTRRNFNLKGGSMFLIWGYSTIVVTLAVYFLVKSTGNFDMMWAWWALPIMGGIATLLHFRKYKRPVKTHIDRTVDNVWLVSTVACMACVLFTFGMSVFGGNRYFNILSSIALMMSIATAITGMIIKFKPVTIGGFTGIILSFLIFFFPGMEQFFVFAGVFLIAQVIPGHILNSYCKKESKNG